MFIARRQTQQLTTQILRKVLYYEHYRIQIATSFYFARKQLFM